MYSKKVMKALLQERQSHIDALIANNLSLLGSGGKRKINEAHEEIYAAQRKLKKTQDRIALAASLLPELKAKQQRVYAKVKALAVYDELQKLMKLHKNLEASQKSLGVTKEMLEEAKKIRGKI